MNLKTLMIIKSVVCLAFGILLLAVPSFVYSIFGGSLSEGVGIFAARQYGSALIGTMLLTWFARNAGESPARRAIILYLFVYDALGAVIMVIATLSGVFGLMGWSVVALYGLLAIGFGYFLFAKPAPVVQPKPV